MFYVISGPSGCGKSTLVGRVLKNLDSVDFSVSFTTRKKRDTETEGKDYYFISEDEFKAMVNGQKLLEWAVVHGHYYGTSRAEIERKGLNKDLLLDVDIQGAKQIREKIKKGVFVFILPPSYEKLRERLQKRGQESRREILSRLHVASKEVRAYSQFDYIIINDKLDEAVQDLESIIRSERCRLEVRQKEIIPILRSFSGDE